jgi:hypothetical protein
LVTSSEAKEGTTKAKDWLEEAIAQTKKDSPILGGIFILSL